MAIDRKAVIERFLPSLRNHSYRVTSPHANRYNCVAWANGVATKWWEPAIPGYYWPERVPSDGTVDSYAILFGRCGFERCQHGSLEPDMEKIAIYAAGYSFRHVARQLPNGNWTSKLGRLEDIEHESLDAICGEEYGKVVIFMQRRRGSALVGAHP